MAKKKKEQELSFMQVPLPSGPNIYKGVKLSWSAFNRRDDADQSMLAEESNISTADTPYMSPAAIPQKLDLSDVTLFNAQFNSDLTFAYPFYNSKSLTFIDNELWIVRLDGVTVYADRLSASNSEDYSAAMTYICEDNNADYINTQTIYPGVVRFGVNSNAFNVVDNVVIDKVILPAFALSAEDFSTASWAYQTSSSAYGFPYYNKDAEYIYGSYVEKGAFTQAQANSKYDNRVAYYIRKLWIVPNKNDDMGTYTRAELYRATLDTSGDWHALVWTKLDHSFVTDYGGYVPFQMYGGPVLPFSATAHGRLVGVNKGKVYISSYNDYSNWDFDTSTDYADSHAWMSETQTTSGAGGNFTAIASYQNHIICFKEDFIHEVTNTKNPFRITDVFSIGTIDQRSVQIVSGLLIFAARDGIYAYNGSSPKLMSYNLNIDELHTAVAGTDGRFYYLYCTDGNDKPYMFTYDTQCGCWARQECIADDSADGYAEVIGYAYNHNKGMYALVSTEHKRTITTDYGNGYTGLTAIYSGSNATITKNVVNDATEIAVTSTPITWTPSTSVTQKRYIAQLPIASEDAGILTVEFDIKYESGSHWHVSVANLTNRDEDFYTSYAKNTYYPSLVGSACTFGAYDGTLKCIYNVSSPFGSSMCDVSGWVHVKLELNFTTKHTLYTISKDGEELFSSDYAFADSSTSEVTGIEFYNVARNDDTAATASINNLTVTNAKAKAEYDGEYLYRIDSEVYGDWWFDTDIFRRGISKYSLTSYGTIDFKHIYKIQLLADIPEGSWYKVYAMYDDDAAKDFDINTAQLVYDSGGKSGRVAGRIKLRKSAARDVRLHFVGNGYIKLYELEYLVVSGGDWYNE